MHHLEPFYNWLHLYDSSEDERSPFYGSEHSEFEFSNTIYNHYIHPQWDDFGSPTLYLKILFIDYEMGYTIIELMGEWNDVIENDVMLLKREIIDLLIENEIYKFILITENVLNFHCDNNNYYEEWYEDIEENESWIAFLNTNEYQLPELKNAHIDRYCFFLQYDAWRTHQPQHLFEWVESRILNLETEEEED